MPQTMSDRWQKIEEIFEIAVELPEDERDAYLEKECGDDAALRREVEDLISADLEADEFIEEPLLGSHTLANFLDEKVGAIDDIENSVPPHFLGRRIGAYRLITELGRGGMGAVFLASRDDEAFKKSVAIKLIKRGMDTDFILKRFRNERQILATLDHPFIARLLDGGTTDDELPYFVMEYIEGTPIHKFCDENRLTIRERLTAFSKSLFGGPLRASESDYSPRLKTRKYSRYERRFAETARFRHCQNFKSRTCRRYACADADRNASDDTGIRFARTDSRRKTFARVGHLQSRYFALRTSDRKTPVSFFVACAARNRACRLRRTARKSGERFDRRKCSKHYQIGKTRKTRSKL